MLKKIISGGQTGADQGGLIAGKALGLQTGGWMPKGFKTEVGNRPNLAKLYGLQEHPDSAYPPRTERNVIESDGTVWFGRLNSPGYHCTYDACARHNRPVRAIATSLALREFVEDHKIETLNVAGNRESRNPGLQQQTIDLILKAFSLEMKT